MDVVVQAEEWTRLPAKDFLRALITSTGYASPSRDDSAHLHWLATVRRDVTSAWLRLQLSRVLLGQPRLIVLNFHVRSAYKSPDRSI